MNASGKKQTLTKKLKNIIGLVISLKPIYLVRRNTPKLKCYLKM